MPVVGGAVMPHPPLIIPQVGRGGEVLVSDTADACRQAAKFLFDLQPDVVVVISPHATAYQDYFHLSPGAEARGSLAQFGAGEISFHLTYDANFTRQIAVHAQKTGIPAGTEGEGDPALDHGTMVPLYFVRGAMGEPFPCSFVRIGLSGLSWETHYRLGQAIQAAAGQTKQRTVILASGDLSHYVRADGPYGFRKEGPEYDGLLMDILSRAAFGELLQMPKALVRQAGQCGQGSFCILAGALDGRKVDAQALCYQGVTGVGYGTLTFGAGEPDSSRCFLKPAGRG